MGGRCRCGCGLACVCSFIAPVRRESFIYCSRASPLLQLGGLLVFGKLVMNILRRKLFGGLVVLVVGFALCVPVAGARDAKDDYGLTTSDAMVIDALIIRPVMVVVTAVGVVAFVASLPFTVLSGSVGKAGNAMVVEPAAYTFTRPLGEFD